MGEVAVLPPVAAVVLDNNGAVADEAVIAEKELVNGAAASNAGVDMAGSDVNIIDLGELSVAEFADGGDDTTTAAEAVSVAPTPRRRRKRSAHGLFRAMFGSFGGSAKKTGGADGGGAGMSPQKKAAVAGDGGDDMGSGANAAAWRGLAVVDSMRPLRLHAQEPAEFYPPPPPPPGHAADVYHDVLLPPPSPARSEGGMTSRYESAVDLQQMDSGEPADHDEEEAAPAAAADGGATSPHAIDVQAEEFIAKFYEQFKSESFNGRGTE